MGYLSIFLDVTAKPCLVVGGGATAERKAVSLLDAGAAVTVVSPDLTPGLLARARAGEVRRIARRYHTGDLDGALLVIAATDDPELHRKIAAEARAAGVPINVVDQPELCSFITPAVVTRGTLQIAVSTGGTSPALAARIRRGLERNFGDEYGLALEILRAARGALKASRLSPDERARRLRALADSALVDNLRSGDFAAVDRIVFENVGVGLESLGISPQRLGLSNPGVASHK
jgi:precorrin-2 dehydrogenase / sirohydrochlorin ferrochelatase